MGGLLLVYVLKAFPLGCMVSISLGVKPEDVHLRGIPVTGSQAQAPQRVEAIGHSSIEQKPLERPTAP